MRDDYEPDRHITEAEYRVWLEHRIPQLAAELTDLLPQDARDAGIHFEWRKIPDNSVLTYGLRTAEVARCALDTDAEHLLLAGTQERPATHCRPGTWCTSSRIAAAENEHPQLRRQRLRASRFTVGR